MLAKIRSFEYLEPSTISEAILLLDKHIGRSKILAGGTDLLINMKQRTAIPEYVIDIKNIPELDYVRYDEKEGLKLGALVTHTVAANSDIVKKKFIPLSEASLAVGSPEIRNRGTIAANICNSSPSADTPPALMALGAKVKLVSVGGERIVNVEDFFSGPFKSIIKENELLAEIQIPNMLPHSGGSYLWLSKVVASVDETLVGAGAVITVDNLSNRRCTGAKIALCSVAPTPIRTVEAENFLKGKNIDGDLIDRAGEIAAGEASPRARAEYRRQMIKVFVRRALNLALERIA